MTTAERVPPNDLESERFARRPVHPLTLRVSAVNAVVLSPLAARRR